MVTAPVDVPAIETPTLQTPTDTRSDEKQNKNTNSDAPQSKPGHHRRRSSSFVVVKHVRETPEQLVDPVSYTHLTLPTKA